MNNVLCTTKPVPYTQLDSDLQSERNSSIRLKKCKVVKYNQIVNINIYIHIYIHMYTSINISMNIDTNVHININIDILINRIYI